MKILFFDQEQDRQESFSQHLRNWGYTVTLSKEEELNSHLDRDGQIECVLLGGLEAIPALVKQLRKRARYLYLMVICSVPYTEERELQLLDAGADMVLWSDQSMAALKSKLQTANRLVNLGLIQFLGSTDGKHDDQVIDIKMGLQYVNDDRSLFLDLLNIVLENAKKMTLDLESLAGRTWEELLQTVETLGVNQLTDWLKGLLQVKQKVRNLEGVQLQQMQLQLNQIIEELEQAVRCLERFGFFSLGASEREVSPLENARVLLVEDMVHNRILVKQILKKKTTNLVEAVNGKEAVTIWQTEGPFDLIMMDMNMPIMDGFAATEEIRRQEQERGLEPTPILALTALAMRGDQEKCLSVGCSGYIPKPVEPRNLISVAENLIGDRGVQTCELPGQNKIFIDKVGLATQNQVYQEALSSALAELGLQPSILFGRDDVLEALEKQSFDLLVLDGGKDLDLAYYAKSAFPTQQLSLVLKDTESGHFLYDNLANVIQYPFQLTRIQAVVEHHSQEVQESKRFQNIMEDFDALKGVKGQGGIAESMAKSDEQLAVWQKAFRKIGGDLVLSHKFNLHGKFGLVLADVSGHDVQSGYTASWFAGLVKGIWKEFPNPIDLLTHLNNLFSQEAEEEDKRYVCALAMLWDPIRQTLHYANAGIPGGILLQQDEEEMEMINWKGAPVGMFPEMDMFDHGSMYLKSGDRLVLATDGVLEHIPEDVVASLAGKDNQSNAQTTLDGLVDFIVRSMEIKDDLTLAVFDAKTPYLNEPGYRSSITSSMESTYEEVKRIQQFVENQARAPFDWPMIAVAVKEALINAVEHGNKNRTDLPVDVDVDFDDQGRLRIRVSDCGKGFDVNREKRRIESEGQLRIQGRGVQLMEHVAHKVEFLGSGVEMIFLPQPDERL